MYGNDLIIIVERGRKGKITDLVTNIDAALVAENYEKAKDVYNKVIETMLSWYLSQEKVKELLKELEKKIKESKQLALL